MKKIFLLFFLIILSCNNNTDKAEILFEKAKIDYANNLFDNSVISLNILIDKYPESEYAVESLYLLHRIYLNEYENYDLSILFLNALIDQFPNHELAKKALFTKGYIYSNHLSFYTDAYMTYNAFITMYPDDELVPSAEYELEGLKTFIADIESLLNKK